MLISWAAALICSSWSLLLLPGLINYIYLSTVLQYLSVCTQLDYLFLFKLLLHYILKTNAVLLSPLLFFFSSKAVITFYTKLWSQLLISPPKRQSATRCVPRRRKTNYRTRSQLGLALKKHDIKHVEMAEKKFPLPISNQQTVSDEWSLSF